MPIITYSSGVMGFHTITVELDDHTTIKQIYNKDDPVWALKPDDQIKLVVYDVMTALTKKAIEFLKEKPAVRIKNDPACYEKSPAFAKEYNVYRRSTGYPNATPFRLGTLMASNPNLAQAMADRDYHKPEDTETYVVLKEQD